FLRATQLRCRRIKSRLLAPAINRFRLVAKHSPTIAHRGIVRKPDALAGIVCRHQLVVGHPFLEAVQATPTPTSPRLLLLLIVARALVGAHIATLELILIERRVIAR